MSALTTWFGVPRHDGMRWSICFAVVIAAHGAAALALLNAPEASDFDAGAPVVMIELTEAPTALATPPTELAPGPTEPESEQTPLKEETKPPEEVAEVVLPEPEPPKPEPPAEEKPPTAMPTVAMMPPAPAPPVAGAAVQPSAALVHRWESELVAHIERFKRYPTEARTRGDQGLARVAFTIDRDGWVRGSRIVQSSGSSQLDQESLAMLTRAQPVPRPPDRVSSRELSFVVPVRFNIR